MKICVIGNSKRHEGFVKYLDELNVPYSQLKNSEDFPEKIDADYVVFPVPTIKNGCLNIENATDGLLPEAVMKITKEGALAITCNYKMPQYNCTDINERDDFAYLNAVPTAEGAIYLALNSSERTLFAQKIIILGFGRVGKILANRLYGLNCDVTIGARSIKDLYYAKALGFNTIELRNLERCIHEYDMIFQTIPAKILNYKILHIMRKNSTVIELSSKMQGTDLEAAEKTGIKVIDGTGLPEKIAPITAGHIWAETVLRIINEHSISSAGEIDG